MKSIGNLTKVRNSCPVENLKVFQVRSFTTATHKIKEREVFLCRILFVEEPRALWVLVKGGLSPVKIKNAEKLDVSDLLQKLKERTRRELISLDFFLEMP